MSDEMSFAERFFALDLLISALIFPFLYLHISGKVTKDSTTLRDILLKAAWEGKSKLDRKSSLRPFGVKIGTIRADFEGLNTDFENIASVLTTAFVIFSGKP